MNSSVASRRRHPTASSSGGRGNGTGDSYVAEPKKTLQCHYSTGRSVTGVVVQFEDELCQNITRRSLLPAAAARKITRRI